MKNDNKVLMKCLGKNRKIRAAYGRCKLCKKEEYAVLLENGKGLCVDCWEKMDKLIDSMN